MSATRCTLILLKLLLLLSGVRRIVSEDEVFTFISCAGKKKKVAHAKSSLAPSDVIQVGLEASPEIFQYQTANGVFLWNNRTLVVK
jgi:hypothetical protein